MGGVLPFYNFLAGKGHDAHWSDELNKEYDNEINPIDYFEKKVVLDLLCPTIMRTKCSVVCDFGCSSGYMLQLLKDTYPDTVLLGSDIIEDGLQKIHKNNPDILLFKLDITNIPFPDKLLDSVVCLSVLEHIKDDENVLKEFYRVLKHGGTACLVVPYGKNLYDYYDKAAMHFRRYAKNELPNKAKNAGFEIVHHTFLNPLLFIPFAIKKRMSRHLYNKIDYEQSLTKLKTDVKMTEESVFLRKFFELDFFLTKKFPRSLPFGIREVMLVKKQ
jgi:ubiquinone/menaquinone biosynthesis C-methylase UbiE